jgi:hypothetical protein
MREDYKGLKALETLALCHKYAYDPDNIVQSFKKALENVDFKQLNKSTKKELNKKYDHIATFLEDFQVFQNAFLEKYIEDIDDIRKRQLDDYLRSCEHHLSTAGTTCGVIMDCLTKLETKRALLWAKTGIVLALALFVVTYLMPPKPEPDQSYNPKFKQDSIELAKIESQIVSLAKEAYMQKPVHQGLPETAHYGDPKQAPRHRSKPKAPPAAPLLQLAQPHAGASRSHYPHHTNQ